MSDSVKAQKLAAARKKLREFQQKAKSSSKKEIAASNDGSISSEPPQFDKQDSLTNSTYSSLNEEECQLKTQPKQECQETHHFEKVISEPNVVYGETTSKNDACHPSFIGNINEPNEIGDSEQLSSQPFQSGQSNLPIYNYFSNIGYDSAYNDRSNFFDNIVNTTSDSKQQLSMAVPTKDSKSNLFNTAVYLDSQLYSNHPVFNSHNEENNNKDAVALDDPEIKQNEIYDNVHKTSMTQDDANQINEYIDKLDRKHLNTEQSVDDGSDEYFNRKDNKISNQLLDEISNMNINEIVQQESNMRARKNSKSEDAHSPHESLLQLSSQIAQLIEPTSEYEVLLPVTDLESRNQQLAALLDQERIKTEQLNAQLQITHDRIAYLEKELEQTKIQQENRVNRELGPVQEQLQYHIQTVGILVAEKTELSAMLTQAQTNLKQKIGECEELQVRLKTSRARVADLEKEIGTMKAEKSKYDNLDILKEETVKRLTEECDHLKETKLEMAQDILELREKLNANSKENLQLQERIQELTSQLSLANIKIQQLTTGENMHVDAQLEILTQQNLALEKQVSDLNQSLKTVAKERDQSSTQYQQYVQQLNNQLANLANRLESVTNENESLVTREQNLVRHMGELEKHLQNLQNERVNAASTKNNNDFKKELDITLEKMRTLEAEKINMEENFTRVSNERDMLMKDLDAKKDSISELESLVEQLQGQQPDNSRLLAAMESDKIAASRAVTQNTELKKQLQDMQDDFVKMSNDKLELTEQLAREQHVNKEVKEKLQQAEIHLYTLAEAIAIKDNELTQLRNSSVELNKQVLQQSQLTDRLRHYEAQDNSSPALQNELQEAKQFIQFLTLENRKLKEALNNKQSANDIQVESNVDGIEIDRKKSVPDSEQEECKIKDVTETSQDSTLDKESAMKYLEQRFMQTMQDIANLTEEKQRLEHLVLQLQSETETIGEYIALYQHQRGILKQRALEKDEQLKQLANDRQEMKDKLEQLNMLVRKLILGKGVLTSEILEQHESLNKTSHQLCEEHSKMHQEMNKITTDNTKSELYDIEKHVESEKGETETAEKIIELLSDIKTSNLVQPSDYFHPCPWCSGKLITV